MSEAQPPKMNSSAGRWHRPRIHLTVVGVYFLVVAIGSFFVPLVYYWATGPHIGGGSGVVFFGMLFFIFFYMIGASVAGLLALRKNVSTPAFIWISIVMLFTIVAASIITYLLAEGVNKQIEMYNRYQFSSTRDIDMAYAYMFAGIGFVIITSVMIWNLISFKRARRTA